MFKLTIIYKYVFFCLSINFERLLKALFKYKNRLKFLVSLYSYFESSQSIPQGRFFYSWEDIFLSFQKQRKCFPYLQLSDLVFNKSTTKKNWKLAKRFVK